MIVAATHCLISRLQYDTMIEYYKLICAYRRALSTNAWVRFQNPVHRAFSERFVPERTADDRIARLKRGKYAMLTKCLYEKHFMESEIVPPALLNDLRTGRTCANQFYIGLGFVKHSPYTKPADLVIQRIFESGLIDYWLSRVTEVRIPPATFKQVYEIKPHSTAANSPPSPLSFRQFKVVVVVWMAGCALSAFVFVAERQYYARNTPCLSSAGLCDQQLP